MRLPLLSQILSLCVPVVKLEGTVHVISVALTTVLVGENTEADAPTGTFHAHRHCP